MVKELKDYISVQNYADFIGKSAQLVYLMIREGTIESVEFQRGKMVGRLVRKPEGYDEWERNKTK